MWTSDDVLRPARWRRFTRWVMALDVDVLLRWALVVMSITMTLFAGLAVVGAIWAGVTALVRTVIGLVF